MVSAMARASAETDGRASTSCLAPAEATEPLCQPPHAGRQRRLQHQALALPYQVRKGERLPNDAPVVGLERLVAIGRDEQRFGQVEEVVAGRAGDGPLGAKVLAVAEDLLHEDRRADPRPRGTRRRPAARDRRAGRAGRRGDRSGSHPPSRGRATRAPAHGSAAKTSGSSMCRATRSFTSKKRR